MRDDGSVTMDTRYFKDFYGCTASIAEEPGEEFPYRLKVSAANGHRFCDRTYRTYKGARAAMGRMGDCWEETT